MPAAFRCVGAALLLILPGCGPDGPARSKVSGRVTYKGQPVSKGIIRFLIDDRPTSMGQIEMGEYTIDQNGGVPVGSGKVEIEGFEDTTKLIHSSPTGVKTYEAKQILPPKYNTTSELTVEIVRGKNKKDFDLQP